MNNKTLEQIENRRLDKIFVTLYVIELEAYIQKDESINKEKVYAFTECNLNGERRFIKLVRAKDLDKVSDYYDELKLMKVRGLENILYAVIPDIENLKKALKLMFKDVEILESSHNSINKIKKYFSTKGMREIEKRIREIYLSETVNEYGIKYENFKENYKDYPFIIEITNHDLRKAKEYYKYELTLRKAIFAFYYIHGFIKYGQTALNRKDYYISTDEMTIEIIPVIQKTEARMFTSKKRWSEIINKIYKTKYSLIKGYLCCIILMNLRGI